jgi:hypothetical protein
MSLKAGSLKSNNPQIAATTKESNQILASIDDSLKNAHEEGRHAIIYSCPINFSVPFMSNKDAQRMIYYKILTSLKERGFNVEIEIHKTETLFRVSWLSKEEIDEIEMQDDVLKKHIKKDLKNVLIRDSINDPSNQNRR